MLMLTLQLWTVWLREWLGREKEIFSTVQHGINHWSRNAKYSQHNAHSEILTRWTMLLTQYIFTHTQREGACPAGGQVKIHPSYLLHAIGFRQ